MSQTITTHLKALMARMAHLRTADTADIAINKPGEAFVRAGGGWTGPHPVDLDYDDCYDLAVLAGALTQQNVGPDHPLLAADLPGGERLQAVLYPCVPEDTVSLTIRIHSDDVPSLETVGERYDLRRWNRWAYRQEAMQQSHATILAAYDTGDVVAFYHELIRLRLNVIMTGHTGSSKTTFLKTLLAAASPRERVITIENAKEVTIVSQPNHVRMLYSHGDQGVSHVTQRQLLEAYLRMRPDLGCVGELRDPEAVYTYVMEAMTGHPGSPSSVHGRNAPEAGTRLFNLFRASDAGRSYDKETASAQLRMVVDCIVPFREHSGVYSMEEIWLAPEAARRGADFRELLA